MTLCFVSDDINHHNLVRFLDFASHRFIFVKITNLRTFEVLIL